ncbi:MAG TPA: DUF1178 family protein [Stellaceae bacterium]|nr:DUF1178 family protein [Stellaceae bacterium]
MILYTLRCAADHEFEAWFRDGATYEAQSAAGEIACPECGDVEIEKAPMAPRVARSKAEPSPADVRRLLQQVRKHVETNCEYVGDKFADEARKIHKGDADKRGIYGEATDAEHRELTEEGIDVHRVPWVPPNDA